MRLRTGTRLILILALNIVACTRQENPQSGIGNAEAGLDLIYSKILQYHPSPFNRHSRAEFEKAYVDLRAQVRDLSESELFVVLSTFTGMIADGHSFVWLDNDTELFGKSVPLRFWEFEDGVYIRAASPEHARLVGGRVLAIGAVPVEEAWSRLRESRPGETPSSSSRAAAVLAQIPEWLQVLDLAEKSDQASYDLLLADGSRETITISASDLGNLSAVWEASLGFATPEGWVQSETAETALWMRNRRTAFWKQGPDKDGMLYVQINRAQRYLDPENRSQDDWLPFVADLSKQLAEERIERLVIDLRHNRGGDTSMQQALIHTVIANEAVNRPGKLFVIAGRMTESASAAMVSRFENESWALVAGESPSSRPNFYNDPRPWYERDVWIVPGSAINFRVSRIIETWTGPGDFRRFIIPDIPAQPTYADFAAGHDPVLDAVKNFDRRKSNAYFHSEDGEFLNEPWLHIYRHTQDKAWPDDPFGELTEDPKIDRRK